MNIKKRETYRGRDIVRDVSDHLLVMHEKSLEGIAGQVEVLHKNASVAVWKLELNGSFGGHVHVIFFRKPANHVVLENHLLISNLCHALFLSALETDSLSYLYCNYMHKSMVS